MYSKSFTVLLITLALIIMSACGGQASTGFPTEQPADSYNYSEAVDENPTINLYLSGSYKQLEQIIMESGVPMNIKFLGDVELKLKIEQYTASSQTAKDNGQSFSSDIDMFGTAGDMWMPGSYVKSRTRLPSTYIVMLANKDYAEKMGWQINQVLPLTELDRAVEEGARIGMTSASQDGAGSLTMLAYMQAHKGLDGEPLQLADLDSSAITGPTDAFYNSVVENVGNTDLLVSRALKDRLDGNPKTDLLFMPESAAYSFDEQLKTQGSEQMEVFYVEGLTSIQTFVIGCSSDIPDANANQCAKVLEHLNSEQAQAQMLALGFRVAAVGMGINDTSSVIFDPSLGFMPNREFIAVNPPKEDVIRAGQIKYQTELKPDSMTGICADHTGSMDEKDGIEQLRAGLKNIMLQDEVNAQKYNLEASAGDVFFLVPFAGDIRAVYRIDGNSAKDYEDTYNQMVREQSPGGGTDINNCAIETLKIIMMNNPDNKYLPAIILLTDGEQSNGGVSFSDLEDFITNNDLDIPIYSIIVGKAVWSDLQDIADLTDGEVCDGRGGEESVVRCFLQFKGNN